VPKFVAAMPRTCGGEAAAATFTFVALVEAIRTHVLAAERIRADDTTVPIWPRARRGPVGYGSMRAMTGPLRDRHRRRCSSIRAIVEAGRKPAPIIKANARRKFFDLARINQALIASEAVVRIDALFAIECEINGLGPQQRVAVRAERSRPLIVTRGCASDAPGCPRTATPARPLTTASSAGSNS
jgi:transposase